MFFCSSWVFCWNVMWWISRICIVVKIRRSCFLNFRDGVVFRVVFCVGVFFFVASFFCCGSECVVGGVRLGCMVSERGFFFCGWDFFGCLESWVVVFYCKGFSFDFGIFNLYLLWGVVVIWGLWDIMFIFVLLD